MLLFRQALRAIPLFEHRQCCRVHGLFAAHARRSELVSSVSEVKAHATDEVEQQGAVGLADGACDELADTDAYIGRRRQTEDVSSARRDLVRERSLWYRRTTLTVRILALILQVGQVFVSW